MSATRERSYRVSATSNQRAVINNPNGSQAAGARPYPGFGDIQWMENRVLSSYNSLQTRFEKRFSAGLSALVSYTLGKALTESPDHISTSGGGPGWTPEPSASRRTANNLKADRGLAEFDVKQRFVVSYIYELPFGRDAQVGQQLERATELILGGWQCPESTRFRAGLGLTATLAGAARC